MSTKRVVDLVVVNSAIVEIAEVLGEDALDQLRVQDHEDFAAEEVKTRVSVTCGFHRPVQLAHLIVDAVLAEDDGEDVAERETRFERRDAASLPIPMSIFIIDINEEESREGQCTSCDQHRLLVHYAMHAVSDSDRDHPLFIFFFALTLSLLLYSQGGCELRAELERSQTTNSNLQKGNLRLEADNLELRLDLEKCGKELPLLREQILHLEK